MELLNLLTKLSGSPPYLWFCFTWKKLCRSVSRKADPQKKVLALSVRPVRRGSGEGQESGCTQGSVSKPRELKPATLEGCCVNSFPCPLGPLILGQVFHRTPLVLALGLSFSHLPGRLPCCHTFSELPPFLCLTASPHPVCLHSHVTPCMQVLVSLSAWGKPDSDRSLGDF